MIQILFPGFKASLLGEVSLSLRSWCASSDSSESASLAYPSIVVSPVIRANRLCRPPTNRVVKQVQLFICTVVSVWSPKSRDPDSGISLRILEWHGAGDFLSARRFVSEVVLRAA
jgi:hypothetical protein